MDPTSASIVLSLSYMTTMATTSTVPHEQTAQLPVKESIKEDEFDVPGRPRSSPKITELDPNLKPILKRKDAGDDPKPKKQVRFDPKFEEENKFISQVASQPTEKDGKTTGVPDYLRNPSKYTKYMFSSEDDNDEEMNKRAFQEFQSLINQSNRTKAELDPSFELPASVTFTPRKKVHVDAMSIDENPIATDEVAAVSSSCLVGVSAEIGNESCEMEEDILEELPTIKKNQLEGIGRRWPKKSHLEWFLLFRPIRCTSEPIVRFLCKLIPIICCSLLFQLRILSCVSCFVMLNIRQATSI